MTRGGCAPPAPDPGAARSLGPAEAASGSSATAPQARTLAVLGAGAWGTALALHAARRMPVRLWTRDAGQIDAMRRDRGNPRYLPGHALPARLEPVASLADAVDGAALIVLAMPVAGLRDTMQALRGLAQRGTNARSGAGHGDVPASGAAPSGTGHGGTPESGTVPSGAGHRGTPASGTAPPGHGDAAPPGIVWLSKGFEASTGLLAHEIAAGCLPGRACGVLSGPSFAQEVADGLPAALTAASRDPALVRLLTTLLHHDSVRIYGSADVVGVEVAGALKNVMAIATGLCDGLALGLNARAALLTRGLAEMTRVGIALGAAPETFAGLAGIGDLVLTCTGDLSRNRQVGLRLAAGQRLDDIVHALGHVAEGVVGCRAAVERGRRTGIELPVSAAVLDVLEGRLAPPDAVRRLLARDPRTEGA